MDSARVIEIIRTLADGRDPATGATFPPASPYQQADTVRALHAALDALMAASATAHSPAGTTAFNSNSPDPQTRQPNPERPQAGKPWTPKEEDHLHTAFADGTPIRELAETHGRTKGAITARLLRLGLLDPTTTHSPVPPHVRPSPAVPIPTPAPPTPPPAVNLPNPPAINRQFSNPVVLSPEDEKNLPF